MTTTRSLALFAGIAGIATTLALTTVASAGPPMKKVNNGPGDVLDPVNPPSDTGPAGGVGRKRGLPRGAKPLVAGPGPRPAASIVAPKPDRSHALTPAGDAPVMADLLPGQVLGMSVGGGTEVLAGIAAGVSANGGSMTSGSLFGDLISMRSHKSPGSSDDTVQVVLLPDSVSQAYDFQFDVSPGTYTVSVDVYWVNDMTAGAPARDRDELIAFGKQRAVDGKLYVTILPEASWTNPAVGYYVTVSRDGADWQFRGASIFRKV